MPAPIAKLIQSLLTPPTAYQACPWQPLADIYRSTRGWLVKLDLAGIKIEDVEVHLSGRQLTVQGFRRDRSIREDHQAYSMEIAYNRFQRNIDLPCEIEGANISTEYDNGMLLVHLACQSRTP